MNLNRIFSDIRKTEVFQKGKIKKIKTEIKSFKNGNYFH